LNSRRLNCFTPDLIAQFEWMSDNLDVALSRRKAEDALKEQERQYRLLFDSAGDSIFIHDAKQRLLAVNHAAYERLGYTHDELVSLSVNQIDSPVHAPSAAAGIEQLMKHGHLTFETEHRHKDGSMFPTEVVARRIIWNGEPAMMSVCRDVTKAKQEAHALRQAKDRADEANLAKSQYLASMSHELRTPLNPILGFADLLAEATNLTDEQRVWLKIISQRGHDLLQLIGNVLDLAKIEADKIVINPEPLLLRQVVGDVSDSSRPAALKKGLALEWNVAEDIPDNLLTDGFRLRQILLNLLNNAIKFTKNGGITLHVQDGRTARLVREPATGEAALLFSVRDTGIGITADRQADIFEPFTQADSKEHVKYEGVGLGLAIVRRLVELSGGRIWVASEPGKGSTFWFTLVVGVSSTTQRQESGKPYVTPAAALIPLNILIVDDDPASLEVETVIVQRVGHRVQTATDGQQALTLMKSQAFDLVLMDETMPVMDGMESTRRIRDWEAPLGRHTRIVALTASAIQGDRARLREGGMDAYLAKPILAAALRDALHGRDTLCA
jgi:PAS domain S-box-containing protein